MTYRNAEHETTKAAPSELLFGRKLRCRFDLLRKPQEKQQNETSRRIKKSQEKQAKYYRHKKGRREEYQRGQAVMVRDYRGVNEVGWTPAEIVRKIGRATYLCQVPASKRYWKRHQNQIIERGQQQNRAEVSKAGGKFGSGGIEQRNKYQPARISYQASGVRPEKHTIVSRPYTYTLENETDVNLSLDEQVYDDRRFDEQIGDGQIRDDSASNANDNINAKKCDERNIDNNDKSTKVVSVNRHKKTESRTRAAAGSDVEKANQQEGSDSARPKRNRRRPVKYNEYILEEDTDNGETESMEGQERR